MNLIANQTRHGSIKACRFYNRSMKSWLEKNTIEMYSTHNEEKFCCYWRFIRTLKNKIYQYMTPRSKKLYINRLVKIVNKYTNTLS